MPDHNPGVAAVQKDTPSLSAEAGAFLALAGPMIVSRLGVAAMGIADGVMLARHSTGQLAVLGLADTLMGRVIDIGIVFVTAGLALAAQARAGAADAQRGVGRVWQTSLLLSLLAGTLVLLFGLFGGPVLNALGQPEALVPDASRVIFILSLGVIPALMAVASAGLLEALGKPIGVAVLVVLANGLNIALNNVLIFGRMGFPEMGAEGAAWSSTLVRTLLALALLASVWWVAGRERYGIRERYRATDWAAGQEQRARGWAGAANVTVLAGLSLVLPVMAGWIGEAAVAQITALWLVMAPAMIVAWGMGDAAGMRVAALLGASRTRGVESENRPQQGQFLPDLRAHSPAMGQKDGEKWTAAVDLQPTTPKPDRLPGQAEGQTDLPERLRATGGRLALVLLIVVLLAAALYLLAPQTVVRWVAHDPALVVAVVPLLPLGLAAIATDAMSILYSGMLRSLGVLRAPFVLHAVTGLAMLPIAWALAFPMGWGVTGLLFAQALVAIVRALALGWLYDRHAARLNQPTTPLLTPA